MATQVEKQYNWPRCGYLGHFKCPGTSKEVTQTRAKTQRPRPCRAGNQVSLEFSWWWWLWSPLGGEGLDQWVNEQGRWDFPQFWVCMANLNLNPGISEGQRKGTMEVQDGSGTSYYTRKEGSALKNVGMSQGQRSQLEGAISGQIWGNLIMKIMKDSNEL